MYYEKGKSVDDIRKYNRRDRGGEHRDTEYNAETPRGAERPEKDLCVSVSLSASLIL
jgi:hypothetical protein